MISSFWFWINIAIFVIKYVALIVAISMFVMSMIFKFVINPVINISSYRLLEMSYDDLIEKIYDLDNYEKKVLYDGRNRVSEFSVISLISVISVVVNRYLTYEFGPSVGESINQMAYFVFKATYYNPFFFSRIQSDDFQYLCSYGVGYTFTIDFLTGILTFVLLVYLYTSMVKYNLFIDRLKLIILMSKDKTKNTKNKIKTKMKKTIIGK
ncbi:hypothetical protein [Apilactobacillus kunkeei]|uniref:hypothetical protein n=1 Tax=Apilactobacillus kunkeei TaxID=148814 RepID=UPI001125F051|nr:hypothetical protein [Apilactobacillus kunkeei]TPR53166.1 hypothetical protein DY036_06985 [Apilactobacillus kunkeei]